MRTSVPADVRLYDQTENDALMRAIGAKGYDPTPPSQHAFYMDKGQPLSNRVVAVVAQGTIRRRAKDGKRSAVALKNDEFLTVADIAKRLKVTVSNCWVAVREAEADGRLRLDEGNHIWFGGNVREPEFPKGEGMAKESTERICTNSIPGRILLFLKTLPPDRADKGIRRQIEVIERFRRRRADAMAYLRERELEDAIAAAAEEGYQEEASPVEKRPGRKRVSKKRPWSVKIEFVEIPAAGSVQNSDLNSVQTESEFEHNPQPYSGESSKEFQRVSGETREPGAAQEQKKEAATPQPKPSTPPPTPPQNLPKEVVEASQSPIVATLEQHFGRKLDKALRDAWLEVPRMFEIPAWSVWRWIGEKFEEKRAQGKRINNPKALLDWAIADLPSWIPENWRAIEADRKWEESGGARDQAEEAVDAEAKEKRARAVEMAMKAGGR